MTRLRSAAFASSFACLAALAACADKPEGDEYEAVLWPSTHQMDEAMHAEVVAVGEDHVTFAKGSAVAASLAFNHVLISGPFAQAPVGMMRRVVAIEPAADGTVVVTTKPAVLQHAFRKLHVRATRYLAPPPAQVDWKVPTGTKVHGQGTAPDLASVASAVSEEQSLQQSFDFFLFNGDNDPSTPEDQVRMFGEMAGEWRYQIGLDLEWPGVEDVVGAIVDVVTLDWDEIDDKVVPELKAGLSAHAAMRASIDVDGMVAKAVSREDTLATNPPTFILVGPLFFTVTSSLVSKVEGGATSRFHVWTGIDGNAGVEASYSSKHGGTLLPPSAEFNTPDPVAEIPSSVHLRAQVGSRLLLALFGMFGPHVTLWSYGDLDADLANDPCWNIRVGAAGDVGIQLAWMGIPVGSAWSEPFDLAGLEVAQGNCIEDTTVTQSQDLCEPAFDFWSEQLVDVARVWTNDDDHVGLEQGADGHWLVSGSRLATLAKVDDDGGLLWARTYRVPGEGTGQDLYVPTAANTADAGILATLNEPALVARLDADGNVLWATRPLLPFEAPEGPKAAIEAPDGSLWVAGAFANTNMGKSDVWLARLDAWGNPLWARRFGLADRGEFPVALVPYQGDVVLVGQQFGIDLDPAHQSFAIRVSPDGTAVWNRSIAGCPGSGSLNVLTAIESRDGDLILGGGLDIGFPEPLLMKLKPDGTLGWSQGRQGPKGDISGVQQLTDGGYLESGTWRTSGDDHLWIARTDSVGNMLWMKQVDDGADDGLATLRLNGRGGALMAAYTGAGDEQRSLWLSRLGVRDGVLPLDEGAGTVTPQEFQDPAGACVAVQDSPVPLAPMDLPFSAQELVATSAAPAIKQLISR